MNNQIKKEDLIKMGDSGEPIYVKHFKYDKEKHPTKYLYVIKGVAHDSSDYNKLYVIYKSIEKFPFIENPIYIRDIDEFCSEIDKEKYPKEYANQKYRFVKISTTEAWHSQINLYYHHRKEGL